MNDPIVEIKSLNKTFKSENQTLMALEDINLSIPRGKFVVLIGPSGCGKTTLINLIAGFEKPTSGSILLEGTPIVKPGPDRGFVFQDYALFPWKTVLGNVMFGLVNNGWKKEEARDRAREFIQMVNLAGFEDVYPHTLSGGMRQRVSIARALAYDPKVLLMDEPFGALDAQTRKHMQKELANIWEKTHKTVIFITHSVIEAVYLADMVVVMTARPGKVKAIVNIDIPRPRDYTEDHYLEERKLILSYLDSEVEKEQSQNPQQ
jgi:NitT/TauT family transport system ATP-binding protein